MKSLSLFIFILLSTSAFGARYGTPVSGHYPGVVLVRGGGLAGTGVLISKDLVLTVNHVVGKGKPGTLKIYFDFMPGYQNKAHDVEDFRIYSKDINYEIALVKLAEPAPVSAYPLHKDPVRPKTTLYGIGYGMTLNPDIRPQTLTKAEMIFNRYDPVLGELLPGPENQLGCPGDSGGPIFLMEGGDARIVGLSGHIVGKFEDDDTDVIACKKARVVKFLPIKNYIRWIYRAALGMNAAIE